MDSTIETIVVLAPWSSGSTAVTGYLQRLGAHSAPPHQPTNDPRNPNSHEPRALRNALAKRANESTLERRDGTDVSFRDWFRDWLAEEHERADEAGLRHMVLKQPLLALFLADIEAVCAARYVVITRPLADIEASRQRRGWYAHYGSAGARRIYGCIFDACVERALDSVLVAYERFRQERAARDRLRQWLDLPDDAAAIDRAEAWLR